MGKKRKNTTAVKTEGESKKEKSAIEEAIDEKVDAMKNESSDKDSLTNNIEESEASKVEAKDESKEEADKDIKESTDKESEEKSEESLKENSEEDIAEKSENDAGDEKAKADNDERNEKELQEDISTIVIPTPYIDSSVEKYKKNKKRRLIVFNAVLIVLVIAYIGGVIYYGKHFSNNTYLNGYNISNMTVSEVDTMLHQNVLDSYSMEVVFKNGTETISVGDGNMYVEPSISVLEIKQKQNPFLWLLNLGTKNEYNVDYIPYYDVEVLTAYIETFDAMKPENMTPSKDAYVTFRDGEAVIVPDVTGTVINKELLISVITAALDGYSEAVNVDEMECYVKADITSDSPSIATAYENANDYLSIEASYEFCEDYTYTLTTEELAGMAYVDNKGQVKISKTNAQLFVEDFAERFSTVQEERKFKTHNGDLILVEGGKWYGWIINPEKEFEEFYELITAKKSFTKEPVCDRKGYSYCELNDIGDTYVEVDLTQQHVYVYIDGKLEIHSHCVTGDMGSGHKTPGGVYSITYMALDVVLTGADYESPVTFWMPFNGGIGLHDATWRGSFEEDTYLYDGSHGCVNLPWENARDIFYMVESGMPVICYWEDEVTFLEEE